MFRRFVLTTVIMTAATECSGMKMEFSTQTCAGLTTSPVSGEVCAVTDYTTRAATYIVAVGAGNFVDTKLLAQGVDVHHALVATFSFKSKEVGSSDEAISKALDAFRASQPAKVAGYGSVPLCAKQAAAYSQAVALIKKLAAEDTVPEKQCGATPKAGK